MILKKVVGNLREMDTTGRRVEKVALEWFELDKRLLRKVSDHGTEVGIALEGSCRLKTGDVLYLDEQRIMAVELAEAEAIVLTPKTMEEMARICYLLGNRHAPVFWDNGRVLAPYDPTLAAMLNKLGIPVQTEKRRLEHALHSAANHHH